MCLLVFKELSEFMVDLLNALQILKKAWNSVSGKFIQNCFKKVQFMEEDEKREVDGNEYKYLYDEAEETWKRLQNSCLVSPTAGFAEYSEADAQVVAGEAITETGILEKIREKSHIVKNLLKKTMMTQQKLLSPHSRKKPWTWSNNCSFT